MKKIIIVIILTLIFLFCLSGIFMVSSFSASNLANKEKYDFLIKAYLFGAISSFLYLLYYLKNIQKKIKK